jgi:hypothetical protein
LARGVGRHGQGDRPRIGEAPERKIECGDGRLLGDPLAPSTLAQAPADFRFTGQIARARGVDPLKSAETEQFASRSILDDPQGVPEVARVAADPFVPFQPVLERLHAAEMLHHGGRVHDLEEG